MLSYIRQEKMQRVILRTGEECTAYALKHDQSRLANAVIETYETKQKCGRWAVNRIGLKIICDRPNDIRFLREDAGKNRIVEECDISHAHTGDNRQRTASVQANNDSICLL